MAQNNMLPTSAPMTTDTLGSSTLLASKSVFRIICPNDNSAGTGFLHKSGNIITAAHVVSKCSRIIILLNNSYNVEASVLVSDQEFDLAVLKPHSIISGPSFSISSAQDVIIGAQVVTWGFPWGYNSLIPMISAGIISGSDVVKTDSGNLIRQFVVNSAFNSGNSGGPLIHVETGEVIGVVVSKIAPITDSTKSALEALEKQPSGFMYTATFPDGSTKQYSEGQIIASVLNELRMQVQLVIGRAAMVGDLRNFLLKNNISP